MATRSGIGQDELRRVNLSAAADLGARLRPDQPGAR